MYLCFFSNVFSQQISEAGVQVNVEVTVEHQNVTVAVGVEAMDIDGGDDGEYAFTHNVHIQ